MNTLFISDLHLDESRPHVTEIFLKFLREYATQAKALYILGDFFEVWIGDDNQSDLNQAVINSLRNLTSNLPVYLMHGNRDFLIGKRFIQDSGCQLISDPTVIDLYGTSTLLMHGDTLCIDDVHYQRFRVKARNRFYQFLFLMRSLKKRREIAKDIREVSQERNQRLAENIMDVNRDELIRVMREHSVGQLIHGHTHRPLIENFEVDDRSVCRIVLSDWNERGNALVCGPNGRRELIYFS